MKKNRKQRRIMFLLILILGITIGFALLSTTLKINGTAGIKSNTWDIHWDDSTIDVKSGSVTADIPVVSTATNQNDTVSFEVNLELPGDFYEFEIDAVNGGSIDGALSVITEKLYVSTDLEHELTGNNIPSYLKYSVKYDDNTTPTEGDMLAHGESKTYKIRVEIDSQADEDDLPDEDETYVIKVDIPYIQHKEEKVVDEFSYNVDSGDDVTYYAPGIDPTPTFNPEWDAFGYNNRTKNESKVCFVYNNTIVCTPYIQYDCQVPEEAPYDRCTNESVSKIYKAYLKVNSVIGPSGEYYLWPAVEQAQFYILTNNGNTSTGFFLTGTYSRAHSASGACNIKNDNSINCEEY